jgi:hypothetical protein
VRPRLAEQVAQLQLGRNKSSLARPRRLELGERLCVAVALGEGLRPREPCFEPPALLRADPAVEVAGIDAETAGKPLQRLGSRPSLSPLDLADVLLREASVGEVGLGQTGGDPELPDTLPEARRPFRGDSIQARLRGEVSLS